VAAGRRQLCRSVNRSVPSLLIMLLAGLALLEVGRGSAEDHVGDT
jgi:hypothetical protein